MTVGTDPRRLRRRAFAAFGIALVLMLAVSAVMFSRELTRIREVRALREAQATLIPEFVLQDQHGQTVHRRDLLGKVWVVTFAHGRDETRIQRAIERAAPIFALTSPRANVTGVVVGAEPLGEVAELDERWLLLVGDSSRVVDLMRVGFGADLGERIVFVDRKGSVRGSVDPTDKRYVEEALTLIKHLLAER